MGRADESLEACLRSHDTMPERNDLDTLERLCAFSIPVRLV